VRGNHDIVNFSYELTNSPFEAGRQRLEASYQRTILQTTWRVSRAGQVWRGGRGEGVVGRGMAWRHSSYGGPALGLTAVQPARHTHGVVTGAVQMQEGWGAWVPPLQAAVDGVDEQRQGTYRKRRHGR